MKWYWRLLAVGLLISLAVLASTQGIGADVPKAVVIAEVNGKAIFNLEVDRLLIPLMEKAPAAEKSDAALRAAVLNQLIDRRLVESALAEEKLAVTSDEIDLEITRLKTELARSKQTLDQFLAKVGQTESLFRVELASTLAWRQYLSHHADETALEAFFKAHYREFDGTELRVSHILLRPATAGDEAAVAALMKEATELRRKLVAGEITFAAAAEKHSAGPSREHGGDLGFIPRHGVMVEPFARAAFALDKGEISPPVATVFGIHLITVTAVKPGDKKLIELHDTARQALSEQLFQALANRERAKAKITFTGKSPYFKPGTSDLVTPGQSGK